MKYPSRGGFQGFLEPHFRNDFTAVISCIIVIVSQSVSVIIIIYNTMGLDKTILYVIIRSYVIAARELSHLTTRVRSAQVRLIR